MEAKYFKIFHKVNKNLNSSDFLDTLIDLDYDNLDRKEKTLILAIINQRARRDLLELPILNELKNYSALKKPLKLSTKPCNEYEEFRKLNILL